MYVANMQISFAITGKLISAVVFAIQIVEPSETAKTGFLRTWFIYDCLLISFLMLRLKEYKNLTWVSVLDKFVQGSLLGLNCYLSDRCVYQYLTPMLEFFYTTFGAFTCIKSIPSQKYRYIANWPFWNLCLFGWCIDEKIIWCPMQPMLSNCT